MFRFTLLCLFCSYCLTSLAQECTSQAHELVAKYTISNISEDGETQSKSLELWRQPNAVLHVYPQTNITEGWERTRVNSLKPTRYFDHYQRAIEYQPGESVHGKQDTDWSFRYQLISDKMLAVMQQKSVSGKGCDEVVVYEFSNDKQSITLHWQLKRQLIQSFKIVTANQEINWSLDSVRYDKHEITQRFKYLMTYQTTDFADIGDDHTDPFLTKMVTQGFIERGASGFFDDKGNQLGHHSH